MYKTNLLKKQKAKKYHVDMCVVICMCVCCVFEREDVIVTCPQYNPLILMMSKTWTPTVNQYVRII